MSDLVGNPEDRFSHNEAHFEPLELASVAVHASLCLIWLDTLTTGFSCNKAHDNTFDLKILKMINRPDACTT